MFELDEKLRVEAYGSAADHRADGQATRYRAGHFLTQHDDSPFAPASRYSITGWLRAR
jgi:Rps23 Pro-64 3,4-dihydroxylase Tpa1-like proline 4-hydroxylase